MLARPGTTAPPVMVAKGPALAGARGGLTRRFLRGVLFRGEPAGEMQASRVGGFFLNFWS
jgi:hypothetical protein